MKRWKTLWELFVRFLQFGCFTFGGGWSIVAQMQKEYVEDKQVISNEELLDLTSVGRSLPGTMIGNVAMLFGHRVAGIPGGIVSVVGLVLPPLVILIIISYFYAAFRSSPWIAAAMTGVRAAVVPIVLGAAAGMVKGAYRLKPCYAVTVICAVLYLFFDVGCVWLVVIGGACGLLISELNERRGGAH